MCNMCSVRCGAASRTLSRVRERSVAAVQWESAGRREPPACLRATGARADARAPPAPRARHAPPAPAHAGRALLTTSPSPSRSGLTHHAIIDVFCEMCRAEQGPRGAARTAGRGAVLRAASRICLDAFLRAPAARHLQRRARRARAARTPLIATVLMPSAKFFASHP